MEVKATETKECYRCERELPADLRHFRKHNQKDDGLHPTCKECLGVDFGLNRPNQVLDARDGFWYCSGCLRELPLDVEHFHRDSSRKSGFKPNCKECRGSSFGVNDPNKVYDAKEGYQFCGQCHRELPQDREHFFKGGKIEGWTSSCKECRGYSFGTDKPNYGRDDGMWECAQCNEVYERTEENFYTAGPDERPGRPNDGLMVHCKECHTRRSNEARRSAENSVESDLSDEAWKRIKQTFNEECAYCGTQPDTIERDHVVPISGGGGTVPENIVPACPSCNRSKSNTQIDEWYPEQPFYDEQREKRIVNVTYDRLRSRNGGICTDD